MLISALIFSGALAAAGTSGLSANARGDTNLAPRTGDTSWVTGKSGKAKNRTRHHMSPSDSLNGSGVSVPAIPPPGSGSGSGSGPNRNGPDVPVPGGSRSGTGVGTGSPTFPSPGQ